MLTHFAKCCKTAPRPGAPVDGGVQGHVGARRAPGKCCAFFGAWGSRRPAYRDGRGGNAAVGHFAKAEDVEIMDRDGLADSYDQQLSRDPGEVELMPELLPDPRKHAGSRTPHGNKQPASTRSGGSSFLAPQASAPTSRADARKMPTFARENQLIWKHGTVFAFYKGLGDVTDVMRYRSAR